MTRRHATPPLDHQTDWTAGPARQAAAAALLITAAAGLSWSVGARRPLAGPRAPGVTLPDRRIDLNGARPAELRLLPGVGPALSERIVAEREAGGPFQNLEDLQRVRGIGPRTAAGLELHVVFGPAPSGEDGGD